MSVLVSALLSNVARAPVTNSRHKIAGGCSPPSPWWLPLLYSHTNVWSRSYQSVSRGIRWYGQPRIAGLCFVRVRLSLTVVVFVAVVLIVSFRDFVGVYSADYPVHTDDVFDSGLHDAVNFQSDNHNWLSVPAGGGRLSSSSRRLVIWRRLLLVAAVWQVHSPVWQVSI